MTDLMRAIFTYLEESNKLNLFRSPHYWMDLQQLSEQEEALLTTCSPLQKELWEQYQLTAFRVNTYEMEAIFQAAWAAARELG